MSEHVEYVIQVFGSDEEVCRDEADALRERRRLEAHGYLVCKCVERTTTITERPLPAHPNQEEM